MSTLERRMNKLEDAFLKTPAPGPAPSFSLVALIGIARIWLHGGYMKARKQKCRSDDWPKYLIFWCPHAESNHDLMITNQLHDLHATGAQSGTGANYSRP